MNISILQVPYDSSRHVWRMGRGPIHLVDGGLPQHLRSQAHDVETIQLELAGSPVAPGMETRAVFDLYAALSQQVSSAVARGRLPVVLSGNCGAALGTLAALSGAGLSPGILWLDAHGDFNTPETTTSGFLDGMGLAAAAGLCWQAMAASIPGHRPVPPRAILHAGARDLDLPERDLMVRRGVSLLPAGRFSQEALAPALDGLRDYAEGIYLHLDLDVLDPAEAPANHFPTPPGGLSVADALLAIRQARRQLNILAVGVASYDPDYDPDGYTLQAAFKLVAEALRARV